MWVGFNNPGNFPLLIQSFISLWPFHKYSTPYLIQPGKFELGSLLLKSCTPHCYEDIYLSMKEIQVMHFEVLHNTFFAFTLGILFRKNHPHHLHMNFDRLDISHWYWPDSGIKREGSLPALFFCSINMIYVLIEPSSRGKVRERRYWLPGE